MTLYHKSGSQYSCIIGKRQFCRIIFSELDCGGLIQISLELLPFDQRPISVHKIEIFVRVLVDQHPQLSVIDVIVPGGFLNGQRVSASHRNVKIVLLACIALAIRHRHLPLNQFTIQTWDNSRPAFFYTLFISIPPKDRQGRTGNRNRKLASKNQISPWRQLSLLFWFFLHFFVAFVSGEEKALRNKAFHGNR